MMVNTEYQNAWENILTKSTKSLIQIEYQMALKTSNNLSQFKQTK